MQNRGDCFDLNFRHAISQACHSCFYHICDLRCSVNIFLWLKVIATALFSKINLIIAIPFFTIFALMDVTKCWRVQNCIARDVKGSYSASSFLLLSPTTKLALWRIIIFTIILCRCTLTSPFINGNATKYFLHCSFLPKNTGVLRPSLFSNICFSLIRSMTPMLTLIFYHLIFGALGTNKHFLIPDSLLAWSGSK